MVESNIPGMNPGAVTPMILMPLPDQDFDPTEASIPWQQCHSRGWRVAFSTENGNVAQGDTLKLTGPLPGLLSAGAKARAAYQQMYQDPFYQHPIPYAEIKPDQYEALILPGGDTLHMRQYLESSILRDKVLLFWQQGKLIGAICHGILVLTRTIDPQTGHSVLYGRKVTALPTVLDRFAYFLDSWFIKRGYLRYSCSVAQEVYQCLERRQDFSSGNLFAPYVVYDGNLVTSRHYGDAELFGKRFTDELLHRKNAEIEIDK